MLFRKLNWFTNRAMKVSTPRGGACLRRVKDAVWTRGVDPNTKAEVSAYVTLVVDPSAGGPERPALGLLSLGQKPGRRRS